MLKNENPLSCASDCTTQDLTLSSGTDTSKAVMFTATSMKDLSFASMGIVGKKTTKSLVQIFTRAGSYNGFEGNSAGWELCFNNLVQLQKGVQTYIDLTCSTYTPSGSSRSFHVYSKNGMNIAKGTSSTSNAFAKVDNAVMLKDLFKQVQGGGLVAGSFQ